MKKTCEFCGKEYTWKEDQSNWYPAMFIKTEKNKYYHGVSSKRFCCFECGISHMKEVQKNTSLTRYGVVGYNNRDKWKVNFNLKSEEEKQAAVQKRIITNLNKYGCENNSQLVSNKEKCKQTCQKKYGVDNYAKTKECQSKMRQTCLDRYGVDNYSKTEEAKEKIKQRNKDIDYKNKCSIRIKQGIAKRTKEQIRQHQDKIYQTKKKHSSFNVSKDEEEVYQALCTRFDKVERQYKSKQYPFSCDFYIPKLNLYIEYQGSWMHGSKLSKPRFDVNNIEHLELMKCLIEKSKTKPQYKHMLRVWTQSDPEKRETVRKNDLNWIEFFTLKEFYEWLNAEKEKVGK